MANVNSMADVMSTIGVYGDSDVNRNSEIYGGSIVLIVLPTLFVTLRLISRWMARAPLWWDDYIVVIGLVLSWGPNIVDLIGSQHGFGKHIWTLQMYSISSFFKYLYAFELLYVFAMSAVKFSIIFFQYRIFPIPQYRRILKYWGIFSACFMTASTLACIFQCVPVNGFWTTLAGTLPGAKCVNVNKFIIIAGSINAATDFILLAMPIPLLWKLRTGRLQKLILTGIFSVGLVVCCVSIVRLVLLGKFDQGDITWTFVPPAIWTAAEPSIGVISACLPSLRPLFAKLVWGRSYRPKMLSRSSHGGYPGGSWRSHGGEAKGGLIPAASDSLHRLQGDGSTGVASGEHGVPEEAPWRHKAHVRAGRTKADDAESDDFFAFGDEEQAHETRRGGGGGAGGGVGGIKMGGIRVRTTVTVTEKVDWLDDLY